MKPVRLVASLATMALIATLLNPLGASAQGDVDLTGAWEWSNTSNQTSTYTGPAEIEHDVGAGTFSFTLDASGPDSSSFVTGHGTVGGTHIQIQTDPYSSSTSGQTYTAQYDGQILADGDRLEGTWTQSDGQDGTFEATRTSAPPSPNPSPSVVECNDKTDNDGDGNIDWPKDSGCTALEDETERDLFARFASTNLAYEQRLEMLKEQLKPTYDRLTTDRDAYQSQLMKEQEALNAAGREQEEARSELKALAAELTQLKEEIGAEITNPQRAQLAEIEAAMLTANDKWRDSTLRVQTVETTVLDYYEKLRIVQEELVKLAEPLAAMDFELQGVGVRAEGSDDPVYRWRYEDGWSQILALTRAIQDIRLKLMESEKHQAYGTFVYLHDAATRQLQATADLLLRNRQIRRATRLVKDLIDLTKSYAEGGPPGLIAEFSKKLVELSVEHISEDPNNTNVGNPIPSKEEVDAWAREGALDSFAAGVKDLAVDKGILDPIKDAVIKDPVSGVLCPALYQKYNEPTCAVGTTFKDLSGKKVAERAQAIKDHWKVMNRRFQALRKLGAVKALTSIVAKKRLKGAGIAAGTKALDIAQDAAEALVGKLTESSEKQAWYEFVYADLLARQAWGLYVASVNGFYDIEDRLKDLTAEKANLLAEWDQTTKQRIVSSKRFRVTEQLIIDVRFSPRFSEAPLPIEVYVSGLKAEAGPPQPWGQKYYITKAQLHSLSKAQRDALVLELR